MINWLLFFPDQPKWIVYLRIIATLFVVLLSLISGIILVLQEIECEGYLGVCELNRIDQ